MPLSARADDGNVYIPLSSGDKEYLYIALGCAVISIITGLLLRASVLKLPAGSEAMQSVGKAIREGALAYLKTQVRTMALFVLAIAISLFFLFKNTYGLTDAVKVAVCFIFGVTCSYAAGFTGMLVAVDGNMRTANAALTSYRRSLTTAFRSGAVTGFMTVGLGLFGACVIFLFAGQSAMRLLVGFGFGSSLAALFMRVGGGIFTKAADVGADLVGKVEAGIPEDDPRNPAVIADNVGDNVGDCAGMAADVFESYSVMLVASIVLGAATATAFDSQVWIKFILFAFLVCGIGILASIIGVFMVRGSDNLDSDPIVSIRKGFYAAAVVAIFGILIGAFLLFGGNKGIETSRLVSIDQMQQTEFKTILAFRRALAKKEKVPTYDIQAQELANLPGINKLGYSKDEIQASLNSALTFDDESAPKPINLSNYRPVDFNDSSNPILHYTVSIQAVNPNSKPTIESFRDAYSQDTGGLGRYKPLPINVYKLAVIPKPAPGQKPVAKVFTAGPVQDSIMKALISQAETTGQATIHIEETYPCTFYYNPANDKIAIGIDGPFEPTTLAKQAIGYFKVKPEVLQEISQDMTALANKKQPPQFAVDFAQIQHKTLPFWLICLPVLFGIFLAFGIEKLTDYYVSTTKKPVQEVAGVSSAGAAPMIIQGFSYAMESSVFMVLSVVIALLLPLWIFSPAEFGTYVLSFYGIALVGLGLLTTTGFILAMDTFGPISDNAQGVFEMSKAGEGNPNGHKAVQRLDAAGNTTKALTKGFAICTAVIAAVALFHSYLEGANLSAIGLRLDYPEIFLGVLIGGAAPYLFSAFSINAVGRSAFRLIQEVRRQFHSDPGIMKGTSKPNYAACVSIVTAAAQRELLGPGILAIFLPIAVGFGFSIGKPATEIAGNYYNLAGAEALGGFLAGAILSGQLMAVLLANSGGIWDNSKKLIEDGMFGGKGTEAHKASVICDTVGDPFKDTAGPALNPLIKVMNLVSLLMAPTIILPLGNITLSIITLVCVAALTFALVFSKKGSLSDDLNKESHAQYDPAVTE